MALRDSSISSSVIARSSGSAHRHAERARRLVEEVGVEAGLLGELRAGVELALAGEHALDRQQRKPVLRRRLAQLLEAEALLLEARRSSSRASRSLGPVEQALGFEVDRHAHIVP